MNRVIQYQVRMVGGSSGVPGVGAIPIKVPDKQCFRVRYVEFKQTSWQNVDVVQLGGVSPINGQRAFSSLLDFTNYTKFMAYHSWAFGESGTTGESGGFLHDRVELWDMDYRLVMPPTVHVVDVGSFLIWNVVLAGELMPCTEGERNAIIAWQGGAKS